MKNPHDSPFVMPSGRAQTGRDWWVTGAAMGLFHSPLRTQLDLDHAWAAPGDPRNVSIYAKGDNLEGAKFCEDLNDPLDGHCFNGVLSPVFCDILKEHAQDGFTVNTKLTRPPEQAILIRANHLLRQAGVTESDQNFFQIIPEMNSGPDQVREMPYTSLDILFAGAGDVWYAINERRYRSPALFTIALPMSEKSQFLLVNRSDTAEDDAHRISSGATIETVFFAEDTAGRTAVGDKAGTGFRANISRVLGRTPEQLTFIGVDINKGGLTGTAARIAAGTLPRCAALVYYSTWSALGAAADHCGSIQVPGCRFFNWCYVRRAPGIDVEDLRAIQHVFTAAACQMTTLYSRDPNAFDALLVEYSKLLPSLRGPGAGGAEWISI